jgi:hypothetical protein
MIDFFLQKGRATHGHSPPEPLLAPRIDPENLVRAALTTEIAGVCSIVTVR